MSVTGKPIKCADTTAACFAFLRFCFCSRVLVLALSFLSRCRITPHDQLRAGNVLLDE